MGAFLVKTAVFMKRMYQKFFSEKRSGDGFDKIFRSEKKCLNMAKICSTVNLSGQDKGRLQTGKRQCAAEVQG